MKAVGRAIWLLHTRWTRCLLTPARMCRSDLHYGAQAAAAQRDAVAVLRRLPEFGVSLLPAQLTSLPDKHQLLQRILFGRHTYAAAAAAAALGGNSASLGSSSSVPPWRRLGDVLELAALLGFDSADEQNEVRSFSQPKMMRTQHTSDLPLQAACVWLCALNSTHSYAPCRCRHECCVPVP